MVAQEQEIYYFNMKYLERCHDSCRMYLKECESVSPHRAVLRCHQHGFIKWLSESQYNELHPVMYPLYVDQDIDDVL